MWGWITDVNWLPAAYSLYEASSFIIFAVINIGSIIAATIFAWWFFRKLRDSQTNLRDFIGSVALAKANLWGWSASNMWAMAFSDSVPPIESLPFRVMWLVVIYIQIRAVMRVRPAQSAEMIVELIRANASNRILILEDDQDVAEIYKLALSDIGYDCVVAGTGSYALDVLDWRMPKLLIVDITLPDMDGYQFIAAARAKGYTGPVIGVSGAPIQEGRGFTARLNKPFKPSELIAVVQENLK